MAAARAAPGALAPAPRRRSRRGRRPGVSALEEIQGFLRCPTPAAWIAAAPAQLGVLLVDHANCEKKAAATALSLIHRYPDDFRLL
ncbi:MAG TPA: tRNA isopentenyl-2-thiomethyl-A-37 hydroxylase MiaE, partial [Gammaproteobacteria bacterium]